MRLLVVAGHGAGDPGAVGFGFTEAERVRALANRIKALGGNSVVLGDTSIDWYASGTYNTVNTSTFDATIELHMDAGVSTAKGGHVIIQAGLDADAYDNNLSNFLNGYFPGRAKPIVGRDDLANPNRCSNRGINYRLVEVCFITNLEDLTKFNNNLDTIAKGILSAFGIGVNPNVTPVTPSPVVKPTSGRPEVRFGVKTLNHGILSQGVQGKANDAIVGIQIGVTQGSVEYRVHCGGRWLPKVTGANWNDHDNGYAGDGKTPIDAIQVYYYTDIEKAGRYYSAVYAVKPYNQNRKLPQVEDTDFENSDGNNTAGIFGIPFTEFTIALK